MPSGDVDNDKYDIILNQVVGDNDVEGACSVSRSAEGFVFLFVESAIIPEATRS